MTLLSEPEPGSIGRLRANAPQPPVAPAELLSELAVRPQDIRGDVLEIGAAEMGISARGIMSVHARRFEWVPLCDAVRLPFPGGSFDTVISRSFPIDAMDDEQQLSAGFNEIMRVLKPRAAAYLGPIVVQQQARLVESTLDALRAEHIRWTTVAGEAFHIYR